MLKRLILSEMMLSISIPLLPVCQSDHVPNDFLAIDSPRLGSALQLDAAASKKKVVGIKRSPLH